MKSLVIVLLAWISFPVASQAADSAVEEPPIAGTYYSGDGLTSVFRLHLDSANTYEFVWSGCVDTHDDQRGTWTISEGRIALRVTGGRNWHPEKFPTVLVPFRWEGRTYLLPNGDVQALANQVNAGREPRSTIAGAILLRDQDWKSPVASGPPLPAELAAYLLARPVRGSIISAIGADSLKVDVGARDGLLPGMVLYVQENRHSSYRVVSVTESEAIATKETWLPVPPSGTVSTLYLDSDQP